MDMDEIMNEISALEREIAILPQGSITKKRIRGRDYFYRRISENGKRKEIYIPFEEVATLRAQIERRRKIEGRLKEYYRMHSELRQTRGYPGPVGHMPAAHGEKPVFRTRVRIGIQLENQIRIAGGFRKRECFHKLREYIFGEDSEKVFILYGLRRTGKTTLIRQMIAELSEEQFQHAVLIQIAATDTLSDLDADIRLLEDMGYKYVFIDEVTLLEDFIEGAAVFADVYASSGMKIVLSGTDSLGFALSGSEQLYDRCILLHTTFIPYREFENVLGIRGIDQNIRFGGTMSVSGERYHEDATFRSAKSAGEYIDTAIAKNIQHSLQYYEYGGHFRALWALYEKRELTNVINRVIENINHRFTLDVIARTFKSHDISMTAVNLLHDRENPMNLKSHIDLEQLTRSIMDLLDIMEKDAQTVDVEAYHMTQIKEYLSLLDLINEIDLEYLPETGHKDTFTVISQPGMRYAQAGAVVESLLFDKRFHELSARERHHVYERLLTEVRGRMMEEIVLLETKLALPNKHVFKLQFPVGEFDMVILDPETFQCEIYEIKHSKERTSEQYRHLIDEEKCQLLTHRYGDIIGKYVIYRGEDAVMDGVRYLNVESYLKSL